MSLLDPIVEGQAFYKKSYSDINAPKKDIGGGNYSYDLSLKGNLNTSNAVRDLTKTTELNIHHDGTDGIIEASSTLGEVYMTGVSIPRSGELTDVSNKKYVDMRSLKTKDPVKLCTTSALPTNTYLSNVLTATTNGALVVDTVTPSINDRVLIKDEVSLEHNGIYDVTIVGDGSTPYVLTRSSDFNTTTNVTNNSYVYVEDGDIHPLTSWLLDLTYTAIIGTTHLIFKQFTQGISSINAGDGLTRTSRTIDIDANQPTIKSIGRNNETVQINPTTDTTGAASAGGVEFTNSTFIGMDGRNGNRAYGQSMYYAPENVNGSWRTLAFQQTNGNVKKTRLSWQQRRNGSWEEAMNLNF